MSLAINIDEITDVMIGNTWHAIEPDTFDLDSYEYMGGKHYGDDYLLHGGGDRGICSLGFCFTPRGFGKARICGPLTAIQAVRYLNP
jgi:hypothetical protein